MGKIRDFKFTFVYSEKPESDELLFTAYSRIFQTAYDNLMRNRGHEPIIKSNKAKNEN